MLDEKELTDGNGNALHVQGTNDMLKHLADVVPETRDEKSKVVEPGAKFAQDQLWRNAPYIDHPSNIPSRQYLGDKLRNPQHLKDARSVTHKPNQYIDGSTDVGFTAQAAPIARWVDLGTYRQNPQPFIDHTFQGMDYDTLFGLEAQAYQKLIDEKGNKD